MACTTFLRNQQEIACDFRRYHNGARLHILKFNWILNSSFFSSNSFEKNQYFRWYFFVPLSGHIIYTIWKCFRYLVSSCVINDYHHSVSELVATVFYILCTKVGIAVYTYNNWQQFTLRLVITGCSTRPGNDPCGGTHLFQQGSYSILRVNPNKSTQYKAPCYSYATDNKMQTSKFNGVLCQLRRRHSDQTSTYHKERDIHPYSGKLV